MRHFRVGLALLLAASTAWSQVVTVTHDADSPVQAGDVVNVTVKAPAGATGTFQVEGSKRVYPLDEGPAGQYTGDFTVRRGDPVNDRRLSVSLQLRDGQILRAEAANRIGIAPAPAPDVVPSTNDLAVSRSEIKPNGWVKVGDSVTMGVVATPGCTVTVTATGLFRDLKLDEKRAGWYAGAWTVPNQADLTVNRPTFFIKLSKDTRSLIVPFYGALMVDTGRPVLLAVTPGDQEVYTTSLRQIVIAYDDHGGAALDRAKLRIVLDGTDLATGAKEKGGIITCALPQNLAVGRHQLGITLVDVAGNSSGTASSSFTIIAGAAALDISHDANASMQAGDSFQVRLNAPTGGRASFTIGTVVVDQPMTEVRTGHYEGEYTLRRNDKLTGMVVVATYIAPDGSRQQVRSNIPGIANGRAPAGTGGALTAPVITAPAAGATVAPQTVLKGTATPGARVEITIDSQARVAGFMDVRGDTVKVAAVVNQDGQWSTAPIAFDRPGLAGRTTFTIVATTVVNDKRSEPTTIKVER